ncbi:hypothetical protein PVAND_000458 [Polypedilum vanderplanki]|uniref:Uncharacterized protein n=1 Tax=Polypedilum vanderplanki TaxID=319348 RepID=A0A9J6BKA3_POLVA|nr:hypothetical protein PVAND_000458 [Polypedilum vanderplanki]
MNQQQEKVIDLLIDVKEKLPKISVKVIVYFILEITFLSFLNYWMRHENDGPYKSWEICFHSASFIIFAAFMSWNSGYFILTIIKNRLQTTIGIIYAVLFILEIFLIILLICAFLKKYYEVVLGIFILSCIIAFLIIYVNKESKMIKENRETFQKAAQVLLHNKNLRFVPLMAFITTVFESILVLILFWMIIYILKNVLKDMEFSEDTYPRIYFFIKFLLCLSIRYIVNGIIYLITSRLINNFLLVEEKIKFSTIKDEILNLSWEDFKAIFFGTMTIVYQYIQIIFIGKVIYAYVLYIVYITYNGILNTSRVYVLVATEKRPFTESRAKISYLMASCTTRNFYSPKYFNIDNIFGIYFKN